MILVLIQNALFITNNTVYKMFTLQSVGEARTHISLRSLLNWENVFPLSNLQTTKWVIEQLNEIFSKPPKKFYAINKTDEYHIDDIWSVDI